MGSLLGFDEEEQKDEVVEEKEEVKRKPYAVWKIDSENEMKLKLTTQAICKLEDKYRRNLVQVLTADDIPPLSIMLTVIQAAAQKYHHKIDSKKIQNIYECYVENGGSQMKLFSAVIMQLLAVSGFFTESQAESLMEHLEDVED